MVVTDNVSGRFLAGGTRTPDADMFWNNCTSKTVGTLKGRPLGIRQWVYLLFSNWNVANSHAAFSNCSSILTGVSIRCQCISQGIYIVIAIGVIILSESIRASEDTCKRKKKNSRKFCADSIRQHFHLNQYWLLSTYIIWPLSWWWNHDSRE